MVDLGIHAGTVTRTIPMCRARSSEKQHSRRRVSTGSIRHGRDLIATPTVDGVGRTWHVLDNGVTDAALTLLCVHGNPDVVVPVAQRDRACRSPRAGDRRRPARDGLLRTHRHDATIATTGRRPLRAHRSARPRGPGRDRRPRLGRTDLARLGHAPSDATRRRDPHEHRGSPTARFPCAGADPSRPAPGCLATRLRPDTRVHPVDARVVTSPLCANRFATRSRALSVGGAAYRHRCVRAGHSP